MVLSPMLRACDCRDVHCPTCSGKRAGDRAREVAAVVETFKSIAFWTMTIDAGAFGERPRDIWLHLLEKQAISECMKRLRRLGWVGRWVAVPEFHRSGMVHVHVILEALQTRWGQPYIDHQAFHDAWNQPRFRPEWAGPVELFASGPKAGEPRPVLGYVQYEKLKKKPGEQRANAVSRYVCGYLSKTGKHPEPQWSREYRNGDVDGKRHNNILFRRSRDFRMGPSRRASSKEPRGRRPYKFKRVEERHRSCRQSSDVMCRAQVLVKGEVVAQKYVYLGTIKNQHGAAVHGCFAGPVAQQLERRPGVWLDDSQAGYLLTDVSPLWRYLKGPWKRDFSWVGKRKGQELLYDRFGGAVAAEVIGLRLREFVLSRCHGGMDYG